MTKYNVLSQKRERELLRVIFNLPDYNDGSCSVYRASKILSLSTSSVNCLIKKKVLPAIRLHNGHLKIYYSDLVDVVLNRFCKQSESIPDYISYESNKNLIEKQNSGIIKDEQENELNIKDLREKINNILNELPAREQKVIRMRFGLDDGYSHTLEEVSHVFGVTRERIRGIEKKALRRLRHPTRSSRLRDFWVL